MAFAAARPLPGFRKDLIPAPGQVWSSFQKTHGSVSPNRSRSWPAIPEPDAIAEIPEQ